MKYKVKPWLCVSCLFWNYKNLTVCYNCAQKRKSKIFKVVRDKNQLRLGLRNVHS